VAPPPTAPEEAEREEDPAPALAFDSAPYDKPAGQDGWTLWLFSFPQEELAVREVERLERLGLGAAYRAVELPDRGRWFRVYAGSFATRAEAREAADALKARLKHDWAQAARF
jgi:cell division septation protein DedD